MTDTKKKPTSVKKSEVKKPTSVKKTEVKKPEVKKPTPVKKNFNKPVVKSVKNFTKGKKYYELDGKFFNSKTDVEVGARRAKSMRLKQRIEK